MMSCPDGRSGPDAPAHTASIRRAFQLRGYIPRTEHRAITCCQLGEVLAFAAAECGKWVESGSALSLASLNLYHLNTWLILPATKQHNCAYVELIATRSQIPKWFVSHWWGERIEDFVRCIKAHAGVRGCNEHSTPYWVCAYANRQHSISDELSVDPQRTSFFRAMQLAVGIVVVLDSHSTPFRRIWCMFEESVALSQTRDARMLFDIATACSDKCHVLTDGPARTDQFHKFEYLDAAFGYIGDCIPAEAPWLVHINKAAREADFPIGVIWQGIQTRLVEAQASVPDDRQHILNHICGRGLGLPPLQSHGRYDEVDRRLRSTFVLAAWRQAAERRLVGEWGFPAILAADAGRRRVSLNFYQVATIDDASMAEVAEGLPNSLEELNLNNTGNPITDMTLSTIGDKLTPRLTRLEWYLAESDIGDKGLGALAKLLPTTLKDLSLSFRRTNVADAGAIELARKLPSMTSLRRLLLFFYSTRLSNDGAVVLAEHLPRNLEDLTLNLFDTQVTDPAAAGIARSLPGTTRRLSVNLGNTAVTDGALESFAAHLPAAVTQLTLVFTAAKGVTDAGLAALAARLPAGLHRLVLHLQQTAVTDSGIAFFTERLPPGIRQLELLLRGTAASNLFLPERAWPLMRKGPILSTEQGHHVVCMQDSLIREQLRKAAGSDGLIDLSVLGEILQCLGMVPSEWNVMLQHLPTENDMCASVDAFVDWLFAEAEEVPMTDRRHLYH